MKEEIRAYLNHPDKLEELYRSAPDTFKSDFEALYSEITEYPAAGFWQARLNYEAGKIKWGSINELSLIFGLAVIAGLIIKLPAIFSIDESFFFIRNSGFIFLPLLIIYFSRIQKTNNRKWGPTLGFVFISVLYINLLPDNPNSNTIVLACIHLPLIIWGLLGFVFQSENKNENNRRLQFLQYNGDLAVMLAILAISIFLLSAITIGLFNLIDLHIEEFYMKNIALCAAAAAPVIGTFLIRVNPQLVHSVSPVIARIFTPLVFITLTIYLIAVVGSGKDPYNDREFLLFFNLLLAGVMALILFSVLETTGTKSNKLSLWMLLCLAAVTIVVNGIALSAILFRIAEWGITPNRLAVFGSNLLMLINLILVAFRIIRSLRYKADTEFILALITAYLPVYLIWCAVVVFLFPVIFGFN
jgi:hypothetical protein